MILYRGVNIAMYESRLALKPRGRTLSEKLFHGHGFYGSGQKLGDTQENSMFMHQRERNSPTSGAYRRGYVSFSKDFEVAKGYALGKHESGYVIEVDTCKFPEEVRYCDLSTTTIFLKKPNDQEVLVWTKLASELPGDIVLKWHRVQASP